MSDPRCKCSLAISLTGDGCRYCQPQEHIDRLGEWLDEARQEAEQAEARVAGIKQIIATEPELPGDMPEEMWQAFVDAINEGDRAFVMTALRIVVKETKGCILDRIHEAERAGGEK